MIAKAPTQKNGLNNVILGKIPPQDIAAEDYVLGVLLVEGHKIDIVRGILPIEDCFYNHANMDIYKTMLELHRIGKPIDLITVSDGLTKSGKLEVIGGAYSLVLKSNAVTSTANVEQHAIIVKEKYLKRKVIQVSMESLNNGYNDEIDVFDLISEVSQQAKELNEHIAPRKANTIRSIVINHQTDIDLRKAKPNDLLGVPCGIRSIDLLTNGFQAKDLCIIGARPSVGKTALALNFALNAAKAGYPTAIFSLEMGANSLLSRLVASMSKIELYKIKKPHLLSQKEFDKYIDITNTIANFDLSIDDTALLSPLTLRSRLNAIALDLAKNGKILQFVVIDYLQLMKSDNKRAANREAVVSDISRELKIIASDMDICILSLSQVNRAVEGRTSNELNLADLRESGAIEQDASMVGFIYSNEPPEQEVRNMFFKIAKNRDGEIGTVQLEFNKTIQLFRDNNSIMQATPAHFVQDNPTKGIYNREKDLGNEPLPF